ncbi:MAG: sigma-54 dependent transcriptional regulator [Bacteroidetes bacterium]|nr:sigma-54 dependent transcriptional regulator [Bacteroidota bacterium]MDA1337131.1 sigma-54 dependent transcriptional regulator [Bacteroidota bacterium]
MDALSIKRRFGIIGTSHALDRAVTVASQVAPTDLSVLVLGESGVGKEVMPRVVHHFSKRKHGPFIAVNCGAIPEGTIDSELFGHEKGAFTGATESRKGYFEEANGGTIFLDEVAELPLTTQVRLLRVLETGEFIRVGSSKVQKTDVRVVAATNVDFSSAIQRGRFREDLYYRLSQVPIEMPPLRARASDIHLLFRKFTTDFSEQYQMPPLSLSPDAVEVLENYPWPGNIRQLKNTTEQMSILEIERRIDSDTLLSYLPESHRSRLPIREAVDSESTMNEREILYKVLFDMRREMQDLKQVVHDLMQGTSHQSDPDLARRLFEQPPASLKGLPVGRNDESDPVSVADAGGWVRQEDPSIGPMKATNDAEEVEEIEEVLSLQDSEKELIRRALAKHRNRRKYAALELGISERTLYRKIKEYGLK